MQNVQFETSFDKIYVIVVCSEDMHNYSRYSMIISTHHLQLSSQPRFLALANFSLICPLRNHVTLLLSHAKIEGQPSPTRSFLIRKYLSVA